jgi:hypothetical protein
MSIYWEHFDPDGRAISIDVPSNRTWRIHAIGIFGPGPVSVNYRPTGSGGAYIFAQEFSGGANQMASIGAVPSESDLGKVYCLPNIYLPGGSQIQITWAPEASASGADLVIED